MISVQAKKKELTNEEKVTEIERENRILYEKMARIHTRRNVLQPTSNKKSFQGNISMSKNRQRLKMINSIEKENRRMLSRLQNSSPTYNVDKWKAERMKAKKYINMRCEYPYMFDKPKNITTNNSSSYGSVRKLFGKNKISEASVNISSINNDTSDADSIYRGPRYTAFSTKRVEGNWSAMSKDNLDASELPGISLPRDAITITHKGDTLPESILHWDDKDSEYKRNLRKLNKIRNTVRSVDQFNPLK